jgi:heme exporter protein C
MTTTETPTGTGSRGSFFLGVVAGLALAINITLGLTLPLSTEQGVYSRMLAIHPAIATTEYLAYAVTVVASILYLWPRTREQSWDLLAGASAEVGAIFTGLTLATGSIWGRPTWGVWWAWEARLTSTAILFFLVLGYLALRKVPMEIGRRSTISAVSALILVPAVVVDHFAVTWWRTLHQGASLAQLTPGKSLDGAFIAAMLVGFLAMGLVYAWLTLHRFRLARLEERVETDGLDIALAERRAEGREIDVDTELSAGSR